MAATGLREAAEGVPLPQQARQIADLLLALTAFEDFRDPTRTANPLTLMATEHGLAVWNFEDDSFAASGPAHELIGLVCCTEETWWRFVPAAMLPAQVHADTTASWPGGT